MENKIDIGQAFKEKMNALDKNPSDLLWSKIETDLDKKRKKRFAFWLFPLVLIFALSFGGFYLYTNSIKKEINSVNQKTEFNHSSTIKNVENQVIEKEVKIEKHKIQAKNNINDVQNSSETINENHFINLKKVNANAISSDNKVNKNQQSKEDSITKKSSKTVVTRNRTYKKSKKLIRSTTEYDEYEVTKKYRYVVKKKKINTIAKGIIAKNQSKNGTKKSNKTSIKKSENPSIKQNDVAIVKSNNDVTPIITESKTTESNIANEVKLAEKELISKELVSKSDTSKLSLAEKTEIKKPKRELKPEDTTKIKKPEIKKIVYFITPFVAPTYYDSFGKTNFILNQSKNFTKNGLTTYNYGIYFRLMADKKKGIRFGICKTDLNYSVKTSNNNTFIESGNIDLSQNINQIYAQFSTSPEVELTQKTGYYEIPLEAYFVLKENKKFGFATIFGISYFNLYKNEVTAKSSSVNEFKIGSSSNTLQANYSINLGGSIYYKINKKINFDINPLFKYQFIEILHDKGFNPYIFALQTGISYKF